MSGRIFYIFLLCIVYVQCIEYENQAKIFIINEELFIETAKDRNISFNLMPGSVLFVNNTNVLDKVKKRLKQNELKSNSNTAISDLKDAENVLKELKETVPAIIRISTNSARLSRSQIRNISRALVRVRQLNLDLSVFRNALRRNKCEVQNNSEGPCKNGGTCYNTYPKLYCECVAGWTGKFCEEDVNECNEYSGTDLACQNNAVCVNSPGSYSCKCQNGFVGRHCSIKHAVCNLEQAEELCGHGVCVQANNAVGYTCICNSGWTKANDTSACVLDENECLEHINPCYAECINLPGSFQCAACPTGYTGNGFMCVDIDECLVENGGCSQRPFVKCINTEGSNQCGRCPPGWTGNGRQCEQLPTNACDNEQICHPLARCEYISDTMICTCPAGMYGHGFGENGCTQNALAHACEQHECKNNGTCMIKGRGTLCLCAAGYFGALCEKNDACNPSPCHNNGKCILLSSNTYRCSCVVGTTGKNCEVLREICGTVISEEAGEISYPNDNSGYKEHEQCSWVITTKNNKVLNVTFTLFDLEESHDCANDQLQIFEGLKQDSHLLGQFCGSKLPMGRSIISTQRNLQFRFTSNNLINGQGLKLFWSSQDYACGGIYNLTANSHGIIRSPGFPAKVPSARECEWTLNAPFEYRFVLRFYEINLGGSENCLRDTLKVYDADMELKRFCESKTPDLIYSSSNKVKVHLHTDFFGVDSSFQMHYEVEHGIEHCGGLYTDTTGYINVYVKGSACLYLIQQPKGTQVLLEVQRSELYDTKNCRLENVEIYDGETTDAPLIKTLCGTINDLEPILSEGNSLLLRYTKHFPIEPERVKFVAKYKRVCDYRFFGPENGTVSTPFYPQLYINDLTCTYHLYGLSDFIVRVKLLDFSMPQWAPKNEISANASASEVDAYNYFEVYTSINNNQRFYTEPPNVFVSENNYMRLVLHMRNNSGIARGMKFEYEFEKLSCGGIFTAKEGSVVKSLFSNEKQCSWIIEAPANNMIKLRMTYRVSRKCSSTDYDFIIYDNSTAKNNQILGSFCGTGTFDDTLSTNIITIMQNVNTPLRVLRIIWFSYEFISHTDSCGGEFKSRFGVIKSPNWPQLYDSSRNCSWHIIAPLGHQIELHVHNFSIEEDYYNNYQSDFLEIRNGPNANSPLIGRYEGINIPQRIPSFTNHLFLFFYADISFTSTGFYITWEHTATGCGGKLNSHEGSIHSPHYQLKDTGAVACDWEITVSKGSTIQLYVTGPKSYQLNSLTLYDGLSKYATPLQLNYKSDQNLYYAESSTNQVLLRYVVKDNNLDAMEFIVDYKTNCNVEIDFLQGVIESPNFPENYPPYMNCAWNLRGKGTAQFSLAFSHMKLETSRHCVFDHLRLIDMQDDVVLAEHRWCEIPLDVFTTKGNHMVLKFFSDDSRSNIGFRAEYKRLGCGDHMSKQYGIFNTPNDPYNVNLDCEWYIEVEAGYRINLIFSKLTIETNAQNCSTDGIVVSESKNSNINLLVDCTVNQDLFSLTSPANRLYIHFYSSQVRTRKYFSATYSSTKSICGGVMRGNSGYITSPNFLGGFQGYLKCQWTVKVETGFGIELKFKEFNITESTNCTSSYLEIQKDFTVLNRRQQITLARSCGEEAPNIKLIHEDTIGITLKVVDNAWGKFALNFVKQCGGIVTAANGYIKSRMGEECEWTIMAANGSYVILDILELECDCKQTANCTNGLRISDQEERNDIENVIYCKTHSSHFTLPTSTLYVTSKNINLRAKYSTVQNSCGGLLTGFEGTLATLPESYMANKECIWQIKTSGMFIEINFVQLDMAITQNCNEEFVEVRDSEAGRLVGVYCGKEKPVNTLVFYESVWIKYRTAATGTYSTFSLTWNLAHYNELNTIHSRRIESPPLFGITEAEPYTWRILLNREERVELEFKEYNRGLQLFDGFDENGLEIDIKLSPWSFLSSSNVVFIKTNNMNLDNFVIVWRNLSSELVKGNITINRCREIITLSSGYVNFSSPAYPAKYKPNLHCEWIIKTEDIGEHAVLELYKLDIEEYSDCYGDYLNIFISTDMENWLEAFKLCGELGNGFVPFKEIHGTPYLKVLFHTDDSEQETGFTSGLSTSCGSNITNPVGSVYRSDRFHNSENCEWQITVRSGRRLNMNVEVNKNLTRKDICLIYAVIYDGVDDHAPIIKPGHICESTMNLESSTNQVTIRFVNTAQPYFGRWNFKLSWREINSCNEEIKLTSEINSVNISSPRYPNVPQPHTECYWLIVAPAGELLEVTFVDRVFFNTRNCDQEYVEFYDGSTTLAPHLGKYCSRKSQKIRSSGNILYIHYITDIAEPHNGFRVNVSLATCGGVYSEFSGEITSPNYPELAIRPKSSICDYHFRSTAFKRDIRFNFTDINLPFNATNPETADRIELISLEDNSTVIQVIYGNETAPVVFHVQRSEILLRFYTFPKLDTYRGFKVSFTHITKFCSRKISGVSGTLTLDNRTPSELYRTCKWKITVPKGQHVKLDIIQLELEETTQNLSSVLAYINRRNSAITLYNDFNKIAKIAEINLATNPRIQPSYKSTDNIMDVIITSRGRIRKFVAQYSSDEDSLCPEIKQDATEGSLYLDQNLKSLNTFYCYMQFQVNAQETISFYIDELEVIYNSYTSNIYAAVFRDELYRAQATEVNKNLTKKVISLAAEQVSLSLYQTDKVRLTALRGKYRKHNCGGSYYIVDGLTIKNPDIDEKNYGILECTWLLKYGFMEHKLMGNVSFMDDCENEYLEIYGSFSKKSLITKLCRDNPQANNLILKRHVNILIYHSENYKPKLSNIYLKLEKTLSCGSVTKVYFTESLQVNRNSYKNNIECTWEFETIVGWYLQLQFTGRFFIEDSVNCTNDYLEIQVSVANIWQPYRRICGREAPAKMQLLASRLRLIFHTNEAVTGDGFTLLISNNCSIQVNVTEIEQTLNGPSSRLYASNDKCVYEFISHTSQLMRVRIMGYNPVKNYNCKAFTAFIKRSSNEEKLDDYCFGANISVAKYLKLSYDIIRYRNFRITYALDNCGGNITDPTTLRSLTTDNYVWNRTCIWHITAPPEHAIIINFLQFKSETNWSCKYRYVKIYEGLSVESEKLHTKICGTVQNNQNFILVNNNEATLESRERVYEKAEYFVADIFFAPNCNENIILNEDNANVTLTQSFSFNTTTIRFCDYLIAAPENSRISLKLKNLQINFTNCYLSTCDNCNYIEILDGLKSDVSMGKYCQNIKSDILHYSSYAGALIRLNARKLVQLNFEISMHLERTECGQAVINLNEADNKVFSLVFPKNNATQYPANAHCSWKIISEQPYVINFDRVLIQNASQITGKCNDYLSIKQKNYETKYFCGNVTGHQVLCNNYKANTTITFHSDGSYEDQGFNISFHFVNSCNRTFNKLNDRIYSFVPNDASCFVEIRVPEQYSLTLMQETCYDLSYNIIDINTNETIESICRDGELLLPTNTNALRLEGENRLWYPITYVSSDGRLQPGCGGNITTPNIMFANPEYDIDRNFSSCRWDLYVPGPNKAVIDFLEFNMGPIANCFLDYVQIWQIDANGKEKLAQTLCGNELPKRIISEGNHLAMVSKKSPNFAGIGWKVRFLSQDTDKI